jgi:hypothetical protein
MAITAAASRHGGTELGLQAVLADAPLLASAASNQPRRSPAMLNYQALQLMHRHDDGSVAPMNEAAHESAASADEELTWLRGGRIFRCAECNEEVVVAPEGNQGSPEVAAG